jgi:hypothetical protein
MINIIKYLYIRAFPIFTSYRTFTIIISGAKITLLAKRVEYERRNGKFTNIVVHEGIAIDGRQVAITAENELFLAVALEDIQAIY